MRDGTSAPWSSGPGYQRRNTAHDTTGNQESQGVLYRGDRQIAPDDAARGSSSRTHLSEVGEDLFRVTLKRDRFANSGDGEARVLFRQHAERIVTAQSCSGYRIVEFHERYDSKLIGSQRVAEGLIACVRA